MSNGSAIIVRQAQAAIKAGQKQQARALLQNAIRQDNRDHRAWAWLATVTPSPKASLSYARRAEMLHPQDPLVRKVLTWAERRTQVKPEASAEAPALGKQLVERHTRRRWQWISRVSLVLVAIAMALAIVILTWYRLNQSVMRSDSGGMALASLATDSQAQIGVAAVAETPSPIPPTTTPTPIPPRVQAKNAVNSDGRSQPIPPRATWTMTPEATDTPTATPTYVPTFISPQSQASVTRPLAVGPTERWVDVNLSTQTLNAYEGDSLVFNSLISSGTWQHPTVTGQFRIWVRYRSQTMDGRRLGYDYYLENVPYVMYFYQDYALHGTYWHNNFGTPMSHGCVNMKTPDAEWIYNWSSVGTMVQVHY
jgi:lipoprotein-anchoring transpeptidase ErfK/SrfK